MLPVTLIGCSSKSYFTVDQARQWGPRVLDGVAGSTEGATGLFCCPSFPLIPMLLETLGAGGGLVGSQDVSPYPPGAYTGEVSAQLLADLGCRFVMAGHPERRRLFGEDDATVHRKVLATAEAGLAPIIVVGEDVERTSAADAVSGQFDRWLDGFPAGGEILVAYEPAWAIGRPQPAPPAHVAESIAIVRELIGQRDALARVVYGGSAQPGTYSDVARAAGDTAAGVPDGLFMARFGVDVDNFLSIVREVRGIAGQIGR
jgi:triosephosphate isomerase